MTENEMVGWHHRLDGHEFEQTLGHSEGQESLMCCMQSMRSQRANSFEKTLMLGKITGRRRRERQRMR